MEKLSIIILTFNEEEYIEAAIKSASFADEILIVDSFSTDKTKELAQ
jgi:glycosyltransferase involved in cell wall biosynthesis